MLVNTIYTKDNYKLLAKVRNQQYFKINLKDWLSKETLNLLKKKYMILLYLYFQIQRLAMMFIIKLKF